eukprot:TRINITY_DN12456_c0_g1_i1.p1 TRINITY_DN12456_c0_g1~~TRINITY_DN12456_c0_g1_i1.p1  ORF type:complete len:197 (-),score=49.81 TRINITY_DN12456_c0_g1_i1:25-570(-)
MAQKLKLKALTSVDFISIYKKYDEDCSGYLEYNEIRNFLKELLPIGLNRAIQEEELDTLVTQYVEQYDTNDDDCFELSELIEILPVEDNFLEKIGNSVTLTQEEFDKVFEKYDQDGNGLIDNEEFFAFLLDIQRRDEEEINMEDIEELAESLKLMMGVYDTDRPLKRDELAMILMNFGVQF